MFFKNKEIDLKQMVKEGKLSELKLMIEANDELLRSAIDDSGMTMLHLGVKYENVELIKFLLDSEGIDVDAEDSSGTTPVLLAFRKKRFAAAKLLMDANAQISSANAQGHTILTYVVQYRITKQPMPGHVLRTFHYKLAELSNGRSPRSVVSAFYCSISLKDSLIFNSSTFTRTALESRSSISLGESRALVVEAMSSYYLDNLRVILSSGPDLEQRINCFLKEFGLLFKGSASSASNAPNLLRKLMDWNMMHLVRRRIETVFQRGEADTIIMLLGVGVVEHVKRLWNEDLMAHLFANKNDKVLRVLSYRQFDDVNCIGHHGRSGLHFAVMAHSRKNIRLLLDKGANIDIQDFSGKSPLFLANDFDSLKLLMASGADVQVINDQGITAFEYNLVYGEGWSTFLRHIAMLLAQGRRLRPKILKVIQGLSYLRIRYHMYRDDIKRMKNYPICGPVTMFTVLTEKPSYLARHMRYNPDECRRLISEFPLRTKLPPSNNYFRSRINDNAKIALRICEFKAKLFTIISRTIPSFRANHLIVQKIVDFLTYEDLCAIFK